MPRLQWLEVSGFRAFADPQRFDFSANLALVWAPNSQGKTSIAEAVEFLLTGATVRRDLLGGAKAEFDSSLRNAHLPDGSPVWVRAGIIDDAGAVHEVCRTLDVDYSADSDCVSRLTVDGRAAVNLGPLGFHLADPPLRAPVLVQHTLRFALSARPQDRADYFKSLLEVQDLETLRDLVTNEHAQLEQPPSEPLSRLRTLTAVPALAKALQSMERGSLRREDLEARLGAAVDVATQVVGLSTDGIDRLGDKVIALSSEIDRLREAQFPTASYRVGDAIQDLEPQPLSQLRTYAEMAAQVDSETHRLLSLFEAVLAMPAVEGMREPIDCPVCEAPASLLPGRISDMRRLIADSRGMEAARRGASAEMRTLAARLRDLRQAADRLLPAALGLTSDEREEHLRRAAQLLDDPDLQPIDEAVVQSLVDAHGRVVSCLDAADLALRTTTQHLDDGTPVDVSAVNASLEDVGRAIEASRAPRLAYVSAAEAFVTPIRGAVDRQRGTEPWRQLAELASDPDGLRESLLEHRVQTRVARELAGAIADLDRAKTKVFDEKFEAMSAEIERWWNLLRPEESVQFASLRRRGTGRRFLMLKARLKGSQSVGIERDALGIFSDSQLNALGLAAFLARCQMQRSPVIVLDDPVQSGDDEHRATFVAYVLDELLRQGTQVIVLSYDDLTSKLMHHRYEHLPLDGFALSLDHPERGVIVAKTSNTAEALLQRAGNYLNHDAPEIRELAATKLRQAAERVAKEIIVGRRTSSGQACTLAEYEDLTLAPLIQQLVPHLDDPSHPGKWRVVGDLLNPGTHDDTPPARNDLKTANGYLKEFVRHYLKQSSGDGSPTTARPRVH